MARLSIHLFVIAFCFMTAVSTSKATLLLDVDSSSGIGFVCSSCTFGYDFDLTNAETVRALGMFDRGADGLVGPHQVGLWNSSEVLLASTTITNSSTVVASNISGSSGRWLFENIVPVNLAPGQYYLGVTQPAVGQDLALRAPVTFNLAGTKNTGRLGGFGGGGATLAFPNSASNADGFFGPNFSTTFIPEPTTLALATLGVLSLGWRRRKVD